MISDNVYRHLKLDKIFYYKIFSKLALLVHKTEYQERSIGRFYSCRFPSMLGFSSFKFQRPKIWLSNGLKYWLLAAVKDTWLPQQHSVPSTGLRIRRLHSCKEIRSQPKGGHYWLDTCWLEYGRLVFAYRFKFNPDQCLSMDSCINTANVYL